MLSLDSTTYTVQNSYDSYFIDQNNKFISLRKGGRFNQSTILQYEDGTEWVFLDNKAKERFCGFLYLQNALNEAAAEKVFPAENKMTIYNRKIIYLSRYCGENKPNNIFDRIDAINILNKIGFKDTAGGANLRKIDDKIFVFDTEKHSFDKSVHEKIDPFVELHNAIRSTLEKKL